MTKVGVVYRGAELGKFLLESALENRQFSFSCKAHWFIADEKRREQYENCRLRTTGVTAANQRIVVSFTTEESTTMKQLVWLGEGYDAADPANAGEHNHYILDELTVH